MPKDLKQLRSVVMEVEKGQIQPVYLFQGDDQYLQKFVVEKIESALFPEGMSEKIILEPNEMSGNEIIEKLYAADLFSSKKIFVLRNPQNIQSSYRKNIFRYCEKPIQSNCLVIILEDFDQRKAIVKELIKRIDPIDVRSPFENKMSGWVRYFFKEKGIAADSNVVEEILKIAGDSLYHLANEIDKIAIYLQDGEELTLDHVYRFSGWKRDYKRWEFLLAVGDRNLQKAIKTGQSLISQNETFLSLMYSLTSLFQELLFIKVSKGTFSQPVGYIPLSPVIKKKLPQLARQFSREKVEKALALLGKIDERIKTTKVSDESELIQFLFNVIPKDG